MSRTRWFLTSINLKTLVWLGPLTFEDIRADFLRMFGSVVVLDADSYICDTEENIRLHREHVARNRGIFGDVSKAPLEDFFTPCSQEHLAAMRDKQESMQKKSLSSAFVGDISQSEDRAEFNPRLRDSANSIALNAVPAGFIS